MKMIREDIIKKKKFAFFWALPELARPPPPNSGNLLIFFLTLKTTFCAYDGIKYQ